MSRGTPAAPGFGQTHAAGGSHACLGCRLGDVAEVRDAAGAGAVEPDGFSVCCADGALGGGKGAARVARHAGGGEGGRGVGAEPAAWVGGTLGARARLGGAPVTPGVPDRAKRCVFSQGTGGVSDDAGLGGGAPAAPRVDRATGRAHGGVWRVGVGVAEGGARPVCFPHESRVTGAD